MLDELIKRYPILERVREDIDVVYGILERCYENGGKPFFKLLSAPPFFKNGK